ncbi:UNVERIFIED_CONTAM: hypothetical protein Sradi_6543100, partial [Sesamum radiatum]
GHLPVCYLGLPLLASRLSISDCKLLLLKIDNRIKGWEGTNLSFVGRVQLIKSVLMALKCILGNDFHIAQRDYSRGGKTIVIVFWKGSSGGGYPNVACQQVCRPIEEMGQGIRDILALKEH